MKTIGTYEAKAHFSKLLKQVENGEEITITKRGAPIARLIPAAESRRNVEDLVAEMNRMREECPLDGVSIRELIEEGRRF